MPAIAKLLNKTMLLTMVASALAENLVINVGTQEGSFLTGDDVGELNAHDYRPGEFVTNDFIYEGLTEWDSDLPNGVDNIPGNEDDYVKPSLATSWTTNLNGTQFEIVFQLRSGVTFHDGVCAHAVEPSPRPITRVMLYASQLLYTHSLSAPCIFTHRSAMECRRVQD